MANRLIVITRAVPGSTECPGISVRTAAAEPRLSRPDLLRHISGADAVVSMFHDRVDDEFLVAAGPQLRGVCNFAVGVDNIDLAACARRGIVVTNTPDAVTEGTANMAFGLLLAAARRIAEGDRFVRSGRFEHDGNTFPTGWLGEHLTAQTLLIVGAGRIGRAVALRSLGFGMRVEYVARTEHPDFEQAPIAGRRVSLEDGLRHADFVSIHTPLTEQTRRLLNADRIALMKPSCIIVNTARGPIIDEGALAAALRQGRIRAAGLDVFEEEPRVHPGLMNLDNVVMTPHIGSGERKYRELMTRMALTNAVAIVNGRPPPNQVNAG